MTSPREVPGILTLLTRALLFAGLWWVLTEGATGSWLIGGPASLLCAWISVRTMPPAGLRPLGTLRFLGFFLVRSLAGGLDVARRVFSPSLPIEPALVDYRTTLPEGWARLLFVNSISLTPGTLGADLDDDRVHVHVLDHGRDPDAPLRDLETRIAAMVR